MVATGIHGEIPHDGCVFKNCTYCRIMIQAGSLSTQIREVSSQFEDYLGRFFRHNAERYAYGPLFEPIYQDLSSFVLRRGKRIRINANETMLMPAGITSAHNHG